MRKYRHREHPLIEERAKDIYAELLPPPGVNKPEWISGGNSDKQEDCRREATSQLKAEGVNLDETFWPFTGTCGDRFICARIEPKYKMSLEFEISPRDGVLDVDPRPDFEGFVKWDGCINFTSGIGIMTHICSVEDFDEIKAAFTCVVELARMFLPSYTGD